MRVIIAGSRDIFEPDLLEAAIRDSGFNITEVFSGTARGVDRLGERWAAQRGIPVRQFPAQCGQYSRAAGMIRNQQMVDEADALIALWDGRSPGTRGTIRMARAKGIPVFVKRC